MRGLMFLDNPFTGDPRVYNEAISLIKAGHQVTVIAWDRERQHLARQAWDGIDVVRLRAGIPLRYGPASWLWNGLSLFLWQRQAYGQALKLNKEGRFGVIHCHDLSALPIGTRLKRKLGVPLVYDAHEIYGHMVSGSLPRWLVRLIYGLEKRLVRNVDRVINVCEPQRRYFESITDKPITVIMNCKPLKSLEYEPSHKDILTVLYIGGLQQARGVPMLVRASKDIPGVRCLVGGTGPPDYVQALKEQCSRISNANFLGRVPFHGVIPMTIKADVVFCMFDPRDPNNRIGMPNKLFEAMVCGRPIICTKGTYSGEVTEEEEVGLAVEYNEQALREAIIKLRDHLDLRERLGRNALKAATTQYNWERQEQKLTELYESLRCDRQ